MDLHELLKNNPNVNITVSLEHLIDAIDYSVSRTKSEFEERQQAEQYLTRKQVAKMLDVDLSTLWRWNKEDYLKAVAIGGKRRYKLSDVQQILKGGNL